MNIDKKWFQLDENRLEEEWIHQAERMYELCSELAEAKKALNDANNALELVEAEQKKDIRLHPANHGLSKITEDAVKSALIVTSAYRVATRDVTLAKYDVDQIQAAVTAMEHKKRALENLVELFGMGYFAEPKQPTPEARRSMEERKSDKALGRRVR